MNGIQKVVGSIPIVSTKQKGTPEGVSFLFVWEPQAHFNARGRQKRRPTVWGPKSYPHLYCFDDTNYKKHLLLQVLFLFF